MSRDLELGIRIRVNNDGTAQVINQVSSSLSGLTSATNSAASATLNQSNTTQRSNAIYRDHVNRLSMSAEAYRASQLALQGLNQTQIQHIQALERTRAQSVTSTAAMSGLNSIVGTFGMTLGAVGLVAFVKEIVQASEQVQNLNLRIKGLTASETDYAAVQDYLVVVSDRHHKSNLDLTGSFSQLLSVEQTGIITRKQSQAILEGMSNVQSKTGASAENLKQSMVGLTQALGMGTLQWEEMKQVTEPLPGLMTKIAEAAGYTGQSAVGDFKAIVSEGGVTSEMFGRIMVEALAKYQGSAEAAGNTLTAKYADISNAWTELVKVIESPVSDAVTPVLNAIARVVRGLAQDFRELKQIKDLALGPSVTGGAADNGMTIDLKGRAQPTAIANNGAGTVRSEIESVADKKAKEKALEKQAEIVDKLTDRYKKATLSAHEYNKQLYASQGFAGEALTKVVALADSVNKGAAAHGNGGQATRAHTAAIREATKEQNEHKRAYDAAMKSADDYVNRLHDEGEQVGMTTKQKADYAAEQIAAMMSEAGVHSKTVANWLNETQKQIVANDSLAKSRKMDDTVISEMQKLDDQYKQLTLSAREYFALSLTNSGITPDKQPPMLQKFDKNTAVEAQQNTLKDKKTALDAYITSLDNATAKTSDFGAITSSIFDSSLGGINKMVGAFDALITNIDSTTDSIKNNAAAQKLNQEIGGTNQGSNALKLMSEELKLNEDLTKAKLSGARQISSALSDSLKQGTTEQRAAHAVAMGIAGVELAMNFQKITGIGLVTAANTASVAPEVAASTIKGTAKAAEAVATQATAGPYIGFALMAAMAAAMAALGFGVGGGSSAPGMTEAQIAATKGAGTVLGDELEVSDSINKTYDLLKSIHAEEYAELRGINRGIQTLQGGITDTVTKIFQTGGLESAMATGNTKNISKDIFSYAMNPLAKFDPILNFISSGLFGKTTFNNIATGIGTGARSVESILNGGDIGAVKADVIAKTTKSWFSTKYSYQLQLSELDKNISSSLNDVFQSMGQTMLGLSKELGGDLEKKLRAYIIPSLSLDLKGLSGEEAAKKLNGVISAAMDKMATTVFGDIIGQYQKLGEGMLETAVRIVSEVAVVKDALATSGLSLADNAIGIGDALAQAAGGLEEFQKQFETFYDKFYSADEKQTRLAAQLESTLSEVFSQETIGLLAKSRDSYRHVMEAININTEKGREQYSMLLQLSSAADTYYSSLTEAQEVLSDNLEKAKSNLATAYKNEADALKGVISRFDEFAKSLRNFRDSLSTGNISKLSPGDKYLEEKRQFTAVAITLSRGYGSTDASHAAYEEALKALPTAGNEFLTASRSYNASSAAYTTDYQTVMSVVNKSISESGDIKSTAERQLAALDKSVIGLIDINSSVLSVKDSIKDLQAATKDGIKDLQTAVAISDATNALGRGLSHAEAQWIIKQFASGRPKADIYSEAGAYIDKINGSHANGLERVPFDGYIAKLHEGERVLTAQEADAYRKPVTSLINTGDNATTLAQQWQNSGDIANQWINNLTKHGRIDGSHKTGLHNVPYDGYIAELHKNERVLTASENDTYQQPTYDDKAVIEQLKATNAELVKQTQAMQKQIEILQSGFTQLIKHEQKQSENLDEIKTRQRVRELSA